MIDTIFNQDFYPTPRNIIELMLQDVDVLGNNFLEPSAGKGDIVKYLNEHGAKQVLAFEKNKDLQKVLCYLTGRDFDKETRLDTFFHNNKLQTNTWYSWSFFEIKGFKKGTLHLKFQNIKDWELLNRAYAKAKGSVLPEKI